MFPDQIKLTASTYNVQISLMFHQVGGYLTTVGINYNESDFEELISVKYRVQGYYNRLVAIDDDGWTTVKRRFS